ncbi:bleomycin resistance protein [Luethyella okanaganae]|uniref:Bleomycin resistance protein n=1 Tax=Luethyella okanaganae TaxID=69372 RepID=A0ABW1VIQ6_9MICO
MTEDRALPNLPSRDLLVTRSFYERLGFGEHYRDDRWMTLHRGTLRLEFFLHPELDPSTSAFQCTVRVSDLDELWEAIHAAGVPVRDTGFPRLHEPQPQSWGLRAGFLIDPDGTQLTLIGEPR